MLVCGLSQQHRPFQRRDGDVDDLVDEVDATFPRVRFLGEDKETTPPYWKRIGFAELESQLAVQEYKMFQMRPAYMPPEEGRIYDYCDIDETMMDPDATVRRWSNWQGYSMLHVLEFISAFGLRSIAFVGDSISGQLYEASKCSLGRYGCLVTETAQDQVKVRCPTLKHDMMVYNLPMPCMDEAVALDNPGRQQARQKQIVDAAEVILFNWGLHTHNKIVYTGIIERLAALLCINSKKKLAMFFESTPRKQGTPKPINSVAETVLQQLCQSKHTHTQNLKHACHALN
jgi:hypothetical protein